jgi:hypothetical protein
VIFSFARKSWPVAAMLVVDTPAVGASPMLAPVGSGANTVAAGPVRGLVLVAVTLNVEVTLSGMFEAMQLAVGSTNMHVALGLILTV